MVTPEQDESGRPGADPRTIEATRILVEGVVESWLSRDFHGLRLVGAGSVDEDGAVAAVIVDPQGQNGIEVVVDPDTVRALLVSPEPSTLLLRELELRYRDHPDSPPPPPQQQQQQQQQQPQQFRDGGGPPPPSPVQAPPGPGNPFDDL